MSDTIGDGCVVQFHYTLTNDAGEVLDSSEGREPMSYLHGAGNIVPGLERQLVGHLVGDSFEAVVPPAEGYGERSGTRPVGVPKSEFPPDAPLHPGVHFGAVTPEGEQVSLWIVEVRGDMVMVDTNHPLAGVTLNFAVNVVGIRAATDEEMAHGHPHHPGDHHHH